MTTIKYLRTLLAILSFNALVTSCQFDTHDNHDHSSDVDEHVHDEHAGHDHAEDHGHTKESKTIIDGNYELFMESSPLISGEKYDATIHITNLSNYKPINSKHITITLKGTETIKTKALRYEKGVFNAAFTPKHIGVFDYIITFADNGISQQITLPKTMVYNHDDYEEVQHIEEANLIVYLKEQAWKEEFGIAKLETKPFSRVIKTSGKILPAPGDETIITALHSGTINLNSKLIEGKKIKKGDVLSTISSNLIHQNLTNDYLLAKNEFEKAKLDYDRAKELVVEKLISEKDYLVAKLDYESAKNSFNNIAKYYSDGNEHVYAQQNGFIRSVFVQQGQFIEEGQPIATIIQNQRILLKADVPQQYNHLASGFYTANFSPVYTDEIYRIADLHGERTSFSSALPENSLFTTVHFEFDAHTNIMPGSYAEVYLKSGTVNNVQIIPVTALMEDQGNYFVFEMVDGEHYRKTYIKTGDTDGEFIEVLAGLGEGTFVVSKGTYQVYLASLGNAAPAHTHAH